MRGPDESKNFWTAQEAAEYCNVSYRCFMDWVVPEQRKKRTKSSVLLTTPPPFIRFGRNCIRFPVAEFKHWVRSLSNPEGSPHV